MQQSFLRTAWYRTVVLGLFKLNIMARAARHEIRVFEGHPERWSLHGFSFAIYLAENFGCVRFRITPDINSKLLRAAI